MISFGIDIGSTTVRAVCGNYPVTATIEGGDLCFLTPFQSQKLDSPFILKKLEEWAVKLPSPEVGTILFTGEAGRTLNYGELGEQILQRWPNLLCAQLDAEAESRLAAIGAGAVALSENRPGTTLIHIDIGGGTSNFASLENGKIIDTACLDIGCRKWVFNSNGSIIERRVPAELIERELKINWDTVIESSAIQITDYLSEIIWNYAKNLPVPDFFVQTPWKDNTKRNKFCLSLSGGILDSWNLSDRYGFGDFGNLFAASLRKKFIQNQIEFYLSKNLGRATVLGVSTHSFQVSGLSNWNRDCQDFMRQIRIYDEKKAKPAKGPVAIHLDTFRPSLTLEEMKKEAAIWANYLRERKEKTIFLLSANLAKTFGHLVNEMDAGVNFIALDELVIPNSGAGIRTLSVGQRSKEGWIPVVIRVIDH